MRSRVVPSLLATSFDDVAQHLAPWSARCKRVELRADQLDLDQMVAACRLLDGETIVTLRRPDEGGSYSGDEEQRHAQLLAALDAGARYVDVELGTELAQRMLASHPQRVVLSHHGGLPEGENFESRIEAMAATPAALLKLVPDARSLDDVWLLRDRLATLEEGRWSIFAMGRAGMLGRLLAPHWGAWGSYAAADPQRPTAADQWSARQMIERYAVDTIGDTTQFMVLVGTAVHAKSPSPAMHQAGYRALGLDRRYIALDIDAWPQARRLINELPATLAVTMPYKAEAAAAATRRDAVSELAAASNTFLPGDDGIEARNSDGPAALQLLKEAGWRPEQSTIIVGAGGTAQAIAAALRDAGGAPQLYARQHPQAEPIDSIPAGEIDWWINATPITDDRWLPDASIAPARCGVLDAVYGAEPSALLAAATAHDRVAIDGLALLVRQGEIQFEWLTGEAPPEGLFAEVGPRELERLA